MPYPNNFS